MAKNTPKTNAAPRTPQVAFPFVIAVVGPTAVGKSDIAVALARTLGGEIISADSRQVYTGLDIGSGKITKKEMRGIRHHLLDVADPKHDRFSVADFVREANSAIDDILSRGNVPIVCGGTGLYVDTLLRGLSLPDVPPNQKLRDKLSKKSANELFNMLAKVDEDRAKTIDRHNPVRLIRALEIAAARGKVPAITQTARFPFIIFGIDATDEKLRSNIERRLDARLKDGMIEEVASLHKHGVTWEKLESFGLEYTYCALYLQKKISREDMRRDLAMAIWHYAKRQRTWWKRHKDIIWAVKQ